MTVFSFITMARTLGNKPGFHHLLTGFTISRWPLQTLPYEEFRHSADPEPYRATAFVLQGLLGSAINWRSFSRALLSGIANPSGWRLVLEDLRNHGRSAEIEGLNPPHDLVNATQDLAHLVKSQGWAWPNVVLGHSMGGKVALQFAESCARGHYGGSAKLPKQMTRQQVIDDEKPQRDGVRQVTHSKRSCASKPNIFFFTPIGNCRNGFRFSSLSFR